MSKLDINKLTKQLIQDFNDTRIKLTPEELVKEYLNSVYQTGFVDGTNHGWWKEQEEFSDHKIHIQDQSTDPNEIYGGKYRFFDEVEWLGYESYMNGLDREYDE